MRTIRAMLVVFIILIASSVVSADISQFSGNWKNVDPNTRGLTTLKIDVRGTRVGIQAWGKCHPSDCAWGYAEGTAYASSVESSLAESAHAVSTIYLTSFSQIVLIIHPTADGQIEVEMLTK